MSYKQCQSGSAHVFVFIVVILVIVGALSIVYWKNFISKSVSLYSSTDLKPINSPITQICAQPSEQKPLDDIYFRGGVSVNFKSTATNKEMKQFLQQGNYTAIFSVLDDPIRVDIVMTPSFIAQHAVPVAEVNDFLTRARKEPYVKDIAVGTNWRVGVTTSSDQAPVTTIDRWGTFVVTLADSTKRDAFLRQYPEATYVMDGINVNETSNSAKLVIMYKASDMLAIVKQIKMEAQLPDAVPNTPTRYSNPPTPTLSPVNERGPGGAMTASALSLEFSSDWDESTIRQLLAKHPEVVSIVAIPDLEPSLHDYVSIRVPENQERCWVRELSKLPLIANVRIDTAAKAE